MKFRGLAAACIITAGSVCLAAQPVFAGGVYVVSNKADQNSIIAFSAGEDGTLTKLGEYLTGGQGTGDLEVPGLSPRDDSHPLLDGQDPLISAFAIEQALDGQFVLVANPGDGTISSMAVNDDSSLTLVDTVKSGGAFPVSIATHGNSVFVANIGSGNFKGYLSALTISDEGRLTLIDGATRKLGRDGGRPSAVRVTPDGKFVIVTHILSGVLAVYEVTEDGLSKKPVSKVDSPQIDGSRSLANPVGFELIPRADGSSVVIVSEARFFAPGLALPQEDGQFVFQTSSTSSYIVDADGQISLAQGDVLTGTGIEGGQRTNCWIGIARDGKYAYGVNALDSSITSYSVADDGSLTMLEETAYKTPEYTFLTDIYPNPEGDIFYQLHGFGGKISVLQVNQDGSLTELQVIDGGVPEVGAFGILSL